MVSNLRSARDDASLVSSLNATFELQRLLSEQDSHCLAGNNHEQPPRGGDAPNGTAGVNCSQDQRANNNNTGATNNNTNDTNNGDKENQQPSQREPVNCLLMSKRQLVNALAETLLGEARANLVQCLHEFTDCAYTKHEQRESIVNSVQCIKLILNRLVKLIYRMVSRNAAGYFCLLCPQ